MHIKIWTSVDRPLVNRPLVNRIYFNFFIIKNKVGKGIEIKTWIINDAEKYTNSLKASLFTFALLRIQLPGSREWLRNARDKIWGTL